MADEPVEKEATQVTTDKLGEMIAGAVGGGIATAMEGLGEKVGTIVDDKIKALKPEEPEVEVKGDIEPTDKASSGAEAKDHEYEKTGGYGTGPGAFGQFCRDVYLDAKAVKFGTQRPERMVTWSKFVAQNKPTLQEADDEQGGFLVPSDVGAHLAATSLEAPLAESHGARKYNLRGNRITVTADVDATHVGSFFGGVTVYRPAEGGVKTASKPTYRQMMLTLHKLVCLVDVTDELLEDASVLALETDVSTKCNAAIQFTKDEDFIVGTGVGQALGLLSSITPGGPVISVAARPAQAAATIIYENIIDMWTRLHTRSQSNAVWMVNHGAFPQLATMNLAVGAGGGPVWIPAGGASASPYNTLLGRPVIFTEKAIALGTVGDIILADWSQYLIAEKGGGVKAASSMHMYFEYDKTVFRFVLRYDGQPSWAIDLTPRNGPTVSPFVVLATRS